jgi:hypothetical protein
MVSKSLRFQNSNNSGLFRELLGKLTRRRHKNRIVSTRHTSSLLHSQEHYSGRSQPNTDKALRANSNT